MFGVRSPLLSKLLKKSKKSYDCRPFSMVFIVMQNKSDLTQTSVLGRKVTYPKHYDPSLLHAVPRSANRDELSSEFIQFQGHDRWTLYELSWLNAKGKPVVALGEVAVDAASTNIIESKSFKLYLNSFNQSRFYTLDDVQERLTQDLSDCADGRVAVNVYPLEQADLHTENLQDAECIDDLDIEVDCYTLRPDFLQDSATGPELEETLCSHLLKSNCLITDQPDWARVVIRYKGAQINREALLRYIISLREHQEFHEHCVERILSILKLIVNRNI